jgi:hypothetical protein
MPVRQYSTDCDRFPADENVQLDAGANFGLNRNTPDVELHSGIAVRF